MSQEVDAGSNKGPIIRDIMLEDIPKLLSMKLRKQDREELIAHSGWIDSGASIVASLMVSSWVNVLVSPTGDIVAVFGFKPETERLAVPWMVATDELKKYPMTLMTSAKAFVREMLELYPVLYNFVDKRNTTSIKWLKALGFIFDTEEYFFHDKTVPFLQFYLTRQEVT